MTFPEFQTADSTVVRRDVSQKTGKLEVHGSHIGEAWLGEF